MSARFVSMSSLLLMAMVLAGCATSCPFAGRSVAEANGRLQHVVLFWLKQPGNAEHRRQIIEASESFRKIPSVHAVRVGEPIPSDRGIVDDSYDVGLLVTVDDRQALQAYLDHPIHVAARDDLLPPLVERVVVYDFQQRGSPGR
jgi:hypothetical protein